MTAFLNHTIDDMRCGRQNWRVLTFFCTSAFFISVAATVATQIF
jgi:hypothetical protein